MASDMKKLSATGDVTTDAKARLLSVIYEGAAAGTCDVRKGGASGTVIASLRLGAAGTVAWTAGDPCGVSCPGGIHVTLSTGTAAVEFLGA